MKQNEIKRSKKRKRKKTFPNGSLFNRWHKFIRSTDKLTSFISCLSISKPHSFVSTLWIIGCEFSEIFCLFFHVEGTINHKRHPLNLSLLLSSLLEFKRKTKLIIIYIKMSTISLIHTNIHTQTFNMCELVFCLASVYTFLTFYPFFHFHLFQIPVLGSTTIQKCSSKPFNTSSAFVVKLLSNIGLIVVAIFILAATVWRKYYPLYSLPPALLLLFFSKQQCFLYTNNHNWSR